MRKWETQALVPGSPSAVLELLTEPDNEPMLRAAAAAGFVQEGTLRRHARRGSVRQDMAILSLLASDSAGAAPSSRFGA